VKRIAFERERIRMSCWFEQSRRSNDVRIQE